MKSMQNRKSSCQGSAAAKGKKMNFFKDIRRNPFSYILVLPAIFYVLLFSYLSYPYMIIAFRKFDYQSGPWGGEFVGLQNFEFFFKSSSASTVIFNTLYLNFLFISFSTIAAVALALLFNEIHNRVYVRISQSVVLLPHFLSWVVVGFMLYSLFSMDYGYFNTFLESFGMKPVNWYTQKDLWPLILTVMRVWKGAGYSAVIYLATITGIDSSISEAAVIDGANRWQICKKITIPLLMPTVCILTIMAIGKIFYGDFGMIYALIGDNGVLYPTTDVIDTYIFRALRQSGDPAQAMAVSLFQSIMGCVCVILANRFTKKHFESGALF